MTAIRNDWTLPEVQALFELPFNDLLFKAQSVHREHFDPNEVQVSTLLSIKTGACPVPGISIANAATPLSI